MIVQLIPFFLAANMSSEDVSSWAKGPELEFDGKVQRKEHSLNSDLWTLSSNSTFKLRCRPKGTDTLSCAATGEKVRIETSNPDEVRTVEFTETLYVDLEFNEDGLESITTGDFVFPIFDIEKKIYGVLSIGANLKDQERVFETQEDISMGRCTRSIYKIKTTPQEANEDHPPNLHLIVTPLEMPNERTTIEISKIRDLDTCNGTTEFLRHAQRSGAKTKVTYAVSKMIITSPGTFRSYSDYRGDVLNEFGNDTIGKIEEVTQLELVSVKEATDDPHVFENPLVESPMMTRGSSEEEELILRWAHNAQTSTEISASL